MTASEIEQSIFNAQNQLALVQSSKAAALTQYEAQVLAERDAQESLARAEALIPDAPETQPPGDLPDVSLPEPVIKLHSDGTFSVGGLEGIMVEAWLWEVQTAGWQAVTGSGVEAISSMPHEGRSIMARYFRQGPGGEHTEDGPCATRHH